jgi:hypothetical protein
LSCKYEQVFLAVSAAVAARRAYGCALALYCCAGAVAKKLGNSTIYFWSNSMKFVSVFVLSLVACGAVARLIHGEAFGRRVSFGLTTNSPQGETVTRKKVAGLSAITETARDLGYAVVPKVALS